MIPAVEIAGARVFLGDCREVLGQLPDNSVDSVVTDPPYELGFMGKSWDSSGVAYDVNLWMDCLRVLKPGGHILAFGGSRTWHRLAVAIEDAGFELRDSIAWLYGSGFPKSLNIAKNIDKKLGVESEVVGTRMAQGSARKIKGTNAAANKIPNSGSLEYDETVIEITQPTSQEGKQWQGWGTALKPAFEPVVVGRKPLVGTVAENVLTWGVGGLNIDGSRIGTETRTNSGAGNGRSKIPSTTTGKSNGGVSGGFNYSPDFDSTSVQGRWPANVILDEVTAGLLDEQSGENPSRFFYVAKASKRDRNEGLDHITPQKKYKSGGVGGTGGAKDAIQVANQKPMSNFHPTVKPTQLMRYLIKLVTPPGGIVLDPFTGSGSTGKAALLDGFGFMGAELTEEYLPIIEGRLRWASEQVEEADDTLF